ncbi:MAG: hypothetical protein MH204_04265 [Fimbriimonadaceae bacterium]|nr:hypothetical protein [Fimbriimonadaceae bacterium]
MSASSLYRSVGQHGYLYIGNHYRYLISPKFELVWFHSQEQEPVVALSQERFVVAEMRFGGGSRTVASAAVLYDLQTGQRLWRGYFHELGRLQPEWPPFRGIQALGPGDTFAFGAFRVRPGFAASLGADGLLKPNILSNYLEKQMPLWGNRSPLRARLGPDYDALWRDVALLDDLASLSNKVERARHTLGLSVPGSFNPGYVFGPVRDATVEGILDAQADSSRKQELLREFAAGRTKALADRINETISGKLLMKSGTVSKDFNPNTAYLVLEAMRAPSLSPVQIRRVNACYLFDLLKTDLGNVVP